MSLFNCQRPIEGRPEPTLQDFIEQEDQICELKCECEIRAKVGDQKCNLTLFFLVFISFPLVFSLDPHKE